MKKKLDKNQYRWLGTATLVAVIFGAYFLRPFFSAIMFAGITAFLFNPIYIWFGHRTKSKSSAASLTFVTSLLIMLLPIIIALVFTVLQVQDLITQLSSSQTQDLGKVAGQLLDSVNSALSGIPGFTSITPDQIGEAVRTVLIAFANGVIDFILSSVGGISSFITTFIIYIYVFMNLLTHKNDLIKMLKGLSPLGTSLTGLYIEKAGAMTKAMVRGQFVIAFCQGSVEAVILELAGIHGYFFFFLVLLTVLSIVPLGGGVVAIPIGIGMLLTGNIWQGLFILLGHFLIITNIDNVLRPKLVPKSVRLNPALTLLAVFSGLAMFGFLGIVLGPVIMIVIKLTIDAYIESRNIQNAKA